jgi:hypothetical protein
VGYNIFLVRLQKRGLLKNAEKHVNEHNFVLRLTKFNIWISAVCIIIFGGGFILSVSGYLDDMDWWFYPVSLIFAVFMIYHFLKSVFWKLNVDGDDIRYRNFFGYTKAFNFENINQVVVKKNERYSDILKMFVRSNKGKLFTVKIEESGYVGYDLLVAQLEKRGLMKCGQEKEMMSKQTNILKPLCKSKQQFTLKSIRFTPIRYLYDSKNEAIYTYLKEALHPRARKNQKGFSESKALRTVKLELIQCNDIENLDFLFFFPALQELIVESKILSGIDGLKYTPLLHTLRINNDWPDTFDISVINQCRELTTLSMGSNAIYSFEIKHNKKIEIKGLETLEKLPKLNHLSLFNVGLKNINFIRNMMSLTNIILSGNLIADLTPLRGNTNVKKMELNHCGIVDISFLADMPNLQSICLEGNRIKDFSPLKDLKELTYIFARNNGLSRREIAKWENILQHVKDLELGVTPLPLLKKV